MKEEQDQTQLKGLKRKIANENEAPEGNQPVKKARTDPIYQIPNSLMALIQADEKNKELWDEVVAEKIRKDLWVEKVQSVR